MWGPDIGGREYGQILEVASLAANLRLPAKEWGD